MPTRPTEALSTMAVLVAAILLGLFLHRARGEEYLAPVKAACLFILAGIAVNAVLCGALSGPKGRYEMRLIWILPVIAGAVSTLGQHRKRSPAVELGHTVTPAA